MKDIVIEDAVDAPKDKVIDYGDLEIRLTHARWMPAWFWEVRHKNVFTMTSVAQGYTNDEKDAQDVASAVCALMSGRAPGPSIIDRGERKRGRPS